MSEQLVLEIPSRRVVSLESPAVLRAPAPEHSPEAPRIERQTKDKDSGPEQAASVPTQGGSRRRRLLAGAALAALLASSGFLYWDYGRHFQATDDAFIATRQFAVAPKVSGFITAVPITDNEHVSAGQVLARIDDRDYRVALAQAQAQLEAAEASVQNIDAQIAVQQAQVDAGEAQVEQVKATLVYAVQQAQRYQDLAATGSGTIQNAQQSNSTLHQQEAGLKTAQASLVATQRQVSTLKAQRLNAEATLSQARAQKQQAELNLSYTTVVAAQPGRAVNLTAATGQYAAVGANLTMFVPDEIWVDANFKETQLDKVRPGQPVTIHIDAYPGHAIRGHVESVQPGSGTAFSLLPAENATGNYVKIVQRVPVKIKLDNLPSDVALGPGMSVVPTVRVDAAPSFYERLRSRI